MRRLKLVFEKYHRDLDQNRVPKQISNRKLKSCWPSFLPEMHSWYSIEWTFFIDCCPFSQMNGFSYVTVCISKMYRENVWVSTDLIWVKRELSCYNDSSAKEQRRQQLRIIYYRFWMQIWDLNADSPANLTFDLSQTRSHLLTCLDNEKLTKFRCYPQKTTFFR